MNVEKVESLASLVDIAEACVIVAAKMTPTESGFMVTRETTCNDVLKSELLKSVRLEGSKHHIKMAWRCGIDNDGGLHIMSV